MRSDKVVAVVVAAGSGLRLGRDEPKALVHLDGQALVRLAVQRLRAGGCASVVVVHTPGFEDAFRDACEGLQVDAWVAGGAQRTDSVRLGVGIAVGQFGAELVAIHDAARALVPPSVVRACIDALGAEGALLGAAPGLPIPDTVKRVDADGNVTATVDRDGLWTVHTPQVFNADAYVRVLQWAAEVGLGAATDDLGLVEAAREAGIVSGRLGLVRSHVLAGKVTWPDDLDHAQRLLAAGIADVDPGHGATP